MSEKKSAAKPSAAPATKPAQPTATPGGKAPEGRPQAPIERVARYDSVDFVELTNTHHLAISEPFSCAPKDGARTEQSGGSPSTPAPAQKGEK